MRNKEEHMRQWYACLARRRKTKAVEVQDKVTGEIFPSIRSVARKFGLRQTGINHQLRDGIHPRFKRL